jgi:predicted NUDIX family NTP pyrophosphohydrolase
MKVAAGIVGYRRRYGGLEVLLLHPSGNYNRHAPWSIPKGEPNPGEIAGACGPAGGPGGGWISRWRFALPGSITYQKSREQVHAFAAECGPAMPRCWSWEVDQAEFLDLDTARQFIHPDQLPLIDRLIESLGS